MLLLLLSSLLLLLLHPHAQQLDIFSWLVRFFSIAAAADSGETERAERSSESGALFVLPAFVYLRLRDELLLLLMSANGDTLPSNCSL